MILNHLDPFVLSTFIEIDTSHTYRLPSESKWEYACRAGTATRFFWGDSDSDSVIVQYCWYSPISHYDIKPLAGKKPMRLILPQSIQACFR
ncbi:MAG: SUMF1/EgtB/PvdO family nonheme iron enzyme [Candidatus Sabulitectum sp.]|nr:SUMF1/EgtB/PvdO family nonheme iron enzyme [Candidatus Sabulitectum sp.]